MSFLDKYRERKFWEKAKKAIRKNPRKFACIDISQAQTLLLYQKYENPEDYLVFQTFLNDLKSKYPLLSIDSLYYLEDPSEKDEHLPETSVLQPKDFEKGHRPNKATEAKLRPLLDKKYDMFIDLTPEFHYIDLWLSAHVQAGFKIGKGWAENKHYNDFSYIIENKNDKIEAMRMVMKYTAVFCADNKG